MRDSLKQAGKMTNQKGELELPSKTLISDGISAETFGGKIHIEWNPDAEVTPIGQLPFFIQYLKLGDLFKPWVEACPLTYTSNNAPRKIDVLGSFLLSILAGHKRYAHMTSLLSDRVNAKLLGMNKVVSDDSARRALKKIDEAVSDTPPNGDKRFATNRLNLMPQKFVWNPSRENRCENNTKSAMGKNRPSIS